MTGGSVHTFNLQVVSIEEVEDEDTGTKHDPNASQDEKHVNGYVRVVENFPPILRVTDRGSTSCVPWIVCQ